MSDLRRIAGLHRWLRRHRAMQHAATVEDWCHRMGAAFLYELIENWEEIVDFIDPHNTERERLRVAVISQYPA